MGTFEKKCWRKICLYIRSSLVLWASALESCFQSALWVKGRKRYFVILIIPDNLLDKAVWMSKVGMEILGSSTAWELAVRLSCVHRNNRAAPMLGGMGVQGMAMGLFPWTSLLSNMLMFFPDLSQFLYVEVKYGRWATMEVKYGRWGRCPGFDLVWCSEHSWGVVPRQKSSDVILNLLV